MSAHSDLLPRLATPVASDARARTETIDSRRLLADSKLVHIQHRGQVYALRETRLGKLILTK